MSRGAPATQACRFLSREGSRRAEVDPRALDLFDVGPAPPRRRRRRSTDQEDWAGIFTLNRKPSSAELTLLVALHHGLAHEVVAAVAERQRPVVDVGVDLTDLGHLVLHLEQIGEVGGDLELDVQLDRLLAVVLDLDRLLEAGGDAALPHHRQVGIDIDRSRRHRLEELDLEVGLLVDRQRLRSDAADREDPARQKARVLHEQAMGLGRRGVEVAPPIADDEGAAIEDADGVQAHDRPPLSTSAAKGDATCKPSITRVPKPRSPARRAWRRIEAM